MVSESVELTKEQRSSIRRHVAHFRQYMNSESYRADQEERKERLRFFQEELPRRIDDFSESDLEELISKLWASRIFGNKTYLAQKIVSENGPEKWRDELKGLLRADDPEAAYGRFLSRVKGLGPASTTEILASLYPERCGIWNRQARDAIRLLGLESIVDPNKYALSVEEYRTFNRLLRAIAHELERAGIGGELDLFFVDYFLYEVAQSAGKSVPDTENFDHNEIRDLLAQMGANLGFDTDTEVGIAHGARVDVVWRARIANLGIVTYVFEVHRSGSIDSLILNLQKAYSAPSVQKVVAVSDDHQLERIRNEAEGLPESFRKALRLWSVRDVLETADHLSRVMESVSSLGLIEASAR